MARKPTQRTPAPQPTTAEVLAKLAHTDVQYPSLPKGVRYLEASAEVRAELLKELVENGSYRMRALWEVDGVVAPNPSFAGGEKTGIDRFELHAFVKKSSAPFTVVVDFEGWTPVATEELFRWLGWASWSSQKKWTDLRILAMGSRLPWYIENIEQSSFGITVRV